MFSYQWILDKLKNITTLFFNHSIVFKSIKVNSEKGLVTDREKVNESLDYIRTLVKYLIFDVEATRRERDYYKEQLKKYKDQN